MNSIEWLEKEIYARGPIGEDTPTWLKELYQQAKAMHKEEITNAYIFGIKDEYVIGAKQYYNTTFKSE